MIYSATSKVISIAADAIAMRGAIYTATDAWRITINMTRTTKGAITVATDAITMRGATPAANRRTPTARGINITTATDARHTLRTE